MDDEAWGIDFEAEVAVITGDVPQGADAARAAREIRLLMLVDDVSLRELIPAGMKNIADNGYSTLGCGFIYSYLHGSGPLRV